VWPSQWSEGSLFFSFGHRPPTARGSLIKSGGQEYRSLHLQSDFCACERRALADRRSLSGRGRRRYTRIAVLRRAVITSKAAKERRYRECISCRACCVIRLPCRVERKSCGRHWQVRTTSCPDRKSRRATAPSAQAFLCLHNIHGEPAVDPRRSSRSSREVAEDGASQARSN